jgi:hypothetical protein
MNQKPIDQRDPRNPNFSYKYQKPSFQVPKQNWIHRNPRLFSGLFIGGCLTVFFSRQIYDIFIRSEDDIWEYPNIIAQQRRRSRD